MTEKSTNPATGRKIELIIRKITSLSTLPGIIASILPLLKGDTAKNSDLASAIESDPSLSARILSMATQQQSGNEITSVSQAIEALPVKLIRDAVMSTKINQSLPSGSVAQQKHRKELIRFSLAVACGARDLAQIMLAPELEDTAFSAGLLHNIGKLAIQESLPKSFEKIVSESQMLGESDISIERKYLDIDHTIIGKRLADKWKLPSQISYSIWLCRSDIQAINSAVSANHLAQVVALAYLIARNSGIGDPCSYEPYTNPLTFAKQLDITASQIEQIQNNLTAQVQKRASLLGLDIEQPQEVYSQAVWELASQLSQDNSDLTEQNQELLGNISLSEFANKFLPQVGSSNTPQEIISDFAINWQNYFKCQNICVYLNKNDDDDLADAVVIDKDGKVNSALLSIPSDKQLVPQEISGTLKAIDITDENLGWLIDQLDTKLNKAKLKAVPIISSGKTVAVVIWEYNYLPSDPDQLIKVLSGPANIAGPVIELSYAYENQQRIAEEFASLLGKLGSIKEKISQTELLDGLAEMAAGAAHELNNPITVVSGRIQMLLDDEKDQDKLKTLSQVKDKIEDISNIVSDLMEFARPQEPSTRNISPAVLVDSAVDYVRTSFKISDIETRIDGLDSLRDIYIDAEQIKLALAHIIANAYQSYHNTGKLVKITGAEQSDKFIRLQIIDQGSGMDTEILTKARQPFFSGQPAGRNRGMGLSHAQRLLHLNKASLHIASESGKGTTVTVLLPCDK